MRTLILAGLLLIVPSALFAENKTIERPYWSIEFKGGLFVPDIDNWSKFYGGRDMSTFGGSLAYKVLRQIEVGIEGMYSRDSGNGFAPDHGEVTGSVKYEVAPLNAFILLRGVFGEEQWLVPYAGGGWTRMFYREEIQYQGEVRGSVDGYHARAGLQLLLDQFDPSAANSFYLDYGVDHTYFFIEANYTRAMIDTTETPSRSINLGGTSWLAGLLFEF